MDDEFFENLDEFFEMMKEQVVNALREKMENGEVDLSKMFQHGFKIEMGPNGPEFGNINPNDLSAMMNQQNNKNTWEKPYTEAYVINDETTYQIITEIPGCETEDVNISFKDPTRMVIQAESIDQKFRKGVLLRFPVSETSMTYIVRNGVLEILLDIIKEEEIEIQDN